MTRTSFESFRRTVTVEWPKTTEENARRFLVKTARRGHANIMAANAARGSVPQWDAFANKPGQTNLDAVILPGPIVYRYRYHGEVIKFALQILRENSPDWRGPKNNSWKYRDSHTVYVNGAPMSVPPTDFKAGDEVLIANPVPYSRKLEVGKTRSGRPFVIQVPPKIYERSARQIRSKYRSLVRINYTFVTIGQRRTPAIVIEAL